MYLQPKHIVAKMNWDTSFDDKARVFEVQERLSRWSRAGMQRDMQEVFDKLCPEEQTWRIGALDLDLGDVDIENFEAELSEKLKELLYEKLTELIGKADEPGSQIELITHQVSQLELVRTFLLQGIVPWNYSDDHRSFHELVEDELKDNFENFIGLVNETGKSRETVRRRMAWQFKEKHLIKIMGGLEPNNHEQIISFSKELIKTQQEARVVQTSTGDFRKNVWLWILNFLLTERGTIFNKVAFMESTLRQMAATYNLSYERLLEIIDQAVQKIRITSTISPDFILALQMLLANQGEPANATVENTAFDNTVGQSSSTKKSFDSPLSAELKQLKVPAALLELAIPEDFPVVTYSKHSAVLASAVALLEELSALAGNRLSQKQLWAITTDFLSNNSAEFALDTFLLNIINVLAEKRLISETKLAEAFVLIDERAANKTFAGMAVQSALADVLKEQVNERITTSGIEKILKKHIDLFVGELKGSSKKYFSADKEKLSLQLLQHPGLAVKILSGYKDGGLNERFASLLDTNVLRELVKAAHRNLYDQTEAFEKLAGKHAYAQFVGNLWIVAFAEAINAPNARVEDKVRSIASTLLETANPELIYADKRLLAALSKSDRLMIVEIVSRQPRWVSTVDALVALTASSDTTKAEFAKTLKKAFRHSTLKKSLFENNSNIAAIINYLVNGGVNLREALVTKYTPFIFKSWPSAAGSTVKGYLTGLFWDCLMQFDRHAGKKDRFEVIFAEHVSKAYPDLIDAANKQETFASTAQSSVYRLKSGTSLSGAEMITLIIDCLKNYSDAVAWKGEIVALEDLLEIALSHEKKRFVEALFNLDSRHDVSRSLGPFMQFEDFCYLFADVKNIKQQTDSIAALRHFALHFLQNKIAALEPAFWSLLLTAAAGKNWQDGFKSLVCQSLEAIAGQTGLDAERIVKSLQSISFRLTDTLKNELSVYLPSVSKEWGKMVLTAPETLLQIENSGLIPRLISEVLVNQSAPAWPQISAAEKVTDLLNQLIDWYPAEVHQSIKNEICTEPQLRWLFQSLQPAKLFDAINRTNPARYALTDAIARLYNLLGRTSVGAVTASELQFILFKKVIGSWSSGNWKTVSPENIWKELMWELCVVRHVKPAQFISAMQKVQLMLPAMLRVSFGFLKDQQKKETAAKVRYPNPEALQPKEMITKVKIKNAGLVLLSAYIPILFERLGLIENKQFRSAAARQEAINYLQYVATGLTDTEEHLLILNKILCGIAPQEPVITEIEISDKDRELIEGMINAIIGHWPAIGSTSIDGFRGNWLVRDGLLTEKDDNWELTVEKRAYDLLIGKSPFTFGTIKFAWMAKPLHVNWNY